jgi:hypothetical protein
MTSAGRRPETLAQRNFRLIGEAAEIITGWPRVRDRLRIVHVPDAEGKCRGCRSQTHRAPEWPCALALVANGGAPEDVTHPVRASHNARLL